MIMVILKYVFYFTGCYRRTTGMAAAAEIIRVLFTVTSDKLTHNHRLVLATGPCMLVGLGLIVVVSPKIGM